jgi:integrase
VIAVDRQRLPDGTISTPKTAGPVIVPDWFADEYKRHDFTRAANTVYVGLRRAGRRAGIEMTPRLLRHAFATSLVNAGCSPEVLRRQMRHHHVSVSLGFYVHTTTADIEEAMRRAFAQAVCSHRRLGHRDGQTDRASRQASRGGRSNNV